MTGGFLKVETVPTKGKESMAVFLRLPDMDFMIKKRQGFAIAVWEESG